MADAHRARRSPTRTGFEPKLDGVRAIALIRDGKVTLLSRSGLDATQPVPRARRRAGRAAGAADGPGRRDRRPGRGRAGPRSSCSSSASTSRGDADIQQAEAEIPGPLLRLRPALRRRLRPARGAPRRSARRSSSALLLPIGPRPAAGALRGGRRGGLRRGRRATAWRGWSPSGATAPTSRASARGTGSRSRPRSSDEFVVGGYSQGAGRPRRHLRRAAPRPVRRRRPPRLRGQRRHRLRRPHARRPPPAARTPSQRTSCPFAEDAAAGQDDAATWVRPELVAEVKFAQWTRDGHLRAPVFLRLREDKPAADVQRADVVAAPGVTRRAEDAAVAPGRDRRRTSVLEQLRSAAREAASLTVEGHKLPAHQPRQGVLARAGRAPRPLTKRDLLAYLARVSPYLLPHLRDRPLTLTRYPNGIARRALLPEALGVARCRRSWRRCGSAPSTTRATRSTSSATTCRPCSGWASSPTSSCTPGTRASTPEPDGHHLPDRFSRLRGEHRRARC